MNKQSIIKIASFTIAIFVLVGAFAFVAKEYHLLAPYVAQLPVDVNNVIPVKHEKQDAVKAFSSEQDFKDYLAKAAEAQSSSVGFYGRGGSATKAIGVMESAPSLAPQAMDNAVGLGGGSAPADRVSGTNVQVAGIDEPDIVKTDGTNIFTSSENFYRYYYFGEPMMEKMIAPDAGVSSGSAGSGVALPSRIMPPQFPQEVTSIIKAFPPKELAKIGKIDNNGNLLLVGKMLAIFTPREIFGYDISDQANPKEKWNLKLQSNSETAGVRKYGDKIYLVIKNQLNLYHPCPIEPMVLGDKPVSIACNRIYHPVASSLADVTYSAMVLNPATGETEKSISFLGSSGYSIMYMSPSAIYLTYSMPADLVKFVANFLKSNAGLMPASVMTRIEKLQSYDLSYNTKTMELSTIVDQYRGSLTDDDRLKFDNEVNNKMDAYLEAHKREMEKTGIVKIGVDDFQVQSTGSVPGTLLNQFSMDENNGNLRLASTIGEGGWWMFGMGGNGKTVNDLYVLDKNLATIGSVKDMGKGERIYSVRFIEDKGYVVTFRQTDPFYVIDLSNAKNPTLKGELKIPGYSSYLHPIAKNIILGVGQENGQVKLSLFDVTDATNPKEVSKYSLDEYWTEVSNNHHAFLQDAKHSIFFLPGGKGGYVFSYTGNNLSLAKAVSGFQAKRALYLNDYLYIVAQDKITVLDEKTWEKAGEMEIK